MKNLILPEGVEFKDPEKVKQALLNICRDSKVIGRAGSTNLPAVKCDVDGLTLGHWYDLWEALGPDVCNVINASKEK